ESSPIVDRFAAKMGITDIYKGCKDKAAAIRSFAEKHALPLTDVCFMGNDVNDLGALEIVGVAAAPADAHPTVLKRVKRVARNRGGYGAARELIDAVLAEASR